MIQTARVFSVIRQMYELIEGTSFTPHPVTAESPVVFLGGIGVDEANEPIIVGMMPDEQPALDWATMGSTVGMNELFALRIAAISDVPGMSGLDALARIEELSATIETALRDQTTGRPSGPFRVDGAQIIWWRVARVQFQPWQETYGVVGQVLIDVAFNVRI